LLDASEAAAVKKRPKFMSDLSDLPEPLRSHRQLEKASGAVSAFEAVGKLHGLIKKDSFPLQTDPKNQHRGFEDTEFLRSLVINASADHYDTQSAMDLSEKETKERRFPLVSLIGTAPGGKLSYHVYLCAHYNGLVLIDPAKPEIMARGGNELANLLEGNRTNNRDRDTLHILAYEITSP
jgi:hypothetical protein